MANHKALSTARQLREDLAIRLSALGAVAAFDTTDDANPLVLLGTQTVGQQNAIVRVKSQVTAEKTSLGLAQRVYSPHIIQVLVEASATADVAILNIKNLMLLLGEVMKHGVKVELYMSANTTVVAVAEITAANLKQSWDHLYHPLTSSM